MRLHWGLQFCQTHPKASRKRINSGQRTAVRGFLPHFPLSSPFLHPWAVDSLSYSLLLLLDFLGAREPCGLNTGSGAGLSGCVTQVKLLLTASVPHL